MNDFSTIINGHNIEYIDDCHIYLVDGVIVPSITQLLKPLSQSLYDNVPHSVLVVASERGTRIHEAIENGDDTVQEVRNFNWLMEKKKISIRGMEIPVLLDESACGRLDLLLEKDGELGIADIKTTSSFNKEYVGLQLNMYRLAYQQSYGEEIKWLAGIHLRGNTRKFHPIPINEEYTRDYLRRNQWI